MLSDLFGANDDEAYESQLQQASLSTAKGSKCKPPSSKLSSGFVGLENQGATCYLNSLIQAMYMTPELRNGLFQIDPEELGVTPAESSVEKKNNADLETFEIDESLLESLLSMGVPEHHARKALLATKNGGFDQVFDYIEKNENTQEFNTSVPPAGDATKKKKRKVRHIPLELQHLFAQLKMADRQAVSTQELTTKGFEWQGVDGQVQHDAHELNRLLIDAIEKSLKRTSGEKLCENLYMGRVVNTIRCSTCGYVSEREESFYDCNMQVIGCSGLVDSLRQYCAAEMLEGDSAYQCDVCKKKQTALRSTVLRSVPPVLTFSCNRFRIDQSTNWQRVKVISRHEFPLAIDMSAFSEGSSSGGGGGGGGFNRNNYSNINAAIQTDKALEEELVSQLRKNTITLSHAVEVAEKWAVMIYQQCDLNLPADSIRQQIDVILTGELESSSALNNAIVQELYGPHSFSGGMMYKLHAVIMHRGSAYSGHYFAFIRDSEKEGNWEMPEPVKVKSKDPVPDKKTVPAKVAEIPPSSVIHRDMLHYYLDFGSAKLYVNKDGPMGAIVTVMIMQHSFAERKKDEGNAAAYSKGAIKEAAESIEGLVANWASVPMSILGREIAKCTGNSWFNQFKPVFGSLESFIESHSNIFEFEPNSKNSSVGLYRSLVREVLMYRSDQFHQEVQKILMPAPTATVPSAPASVEDGIHSSSTTTTNPPSQDAFYFEECTEDEALARALQQSLNEDQAIITTTTAASASAEGDWEVAGTKKKEKKSVKKESNPAPSNAGRRAVKSVQAIRSPPRAQKGNTTTKEAASPHRLPPPPPPTLPHESSSSSSSVAIEDLEEELKSAEISAAEAETVHAKEEYDRSESLRYIKNRILNHFFGPFFNFNDSVVTSMEVASLQAAFEGQDSAYLLVYRRVTAQAIGLAPPPLWWQHQVTRMNATIASERLAYDMTNRMISICVRCPKHVQPDAHPSPLLKAVDGDGEGTCVVMDFDGRQTVQEFLDAFLSGHIAELDELGLGFCKQDGRLVHEHVCIHTLEFHSRLGGFHVASKVDLESTLSDSVKDHGSILLWNGSFINRVKVSTGPTAVPHTAAVFHLDFSSSTSHRPTAEVRNQISPLCLPFALALGDLCSAIASRFGGLSNKSTLCIHLVIKYTSFMSILNKKVPQSADAKKAGVGERRQQVVALNLFEKGSLSAVAKNNLFPWLMSSKGKSFSNVSLGDLCFGEFVDLLRPKCATVAVLENRSSNRSDVELWVEEYESRGLRTQSIAELFATQWNSHLTVEVVLRFDPSKIGGSLLGAAVEGDGSHSSTCDDKESAQVTFDLLLSSSLLDEPAFGKVKVEVSTLSTVKELKLKALAAFQLDAATLSDSVFLKTVESLDDESVCVLESGIGEGKVVSLCMRSKEDDSQNGTTATKMVKIKIILIGDCEVGGVSLTRVHLKEAFLDVPKDSTITSVRDQAGVLLLDYPPEWTSTVSKSTTASKEEASVTDNTTSKLTMPTPMRLRKATWMGEAGQLLIEGRADVAAASSSSSSSAVATVESAGLRDGDILLLEEGSPPIKGSSVLKVFVWQPLSYSSSTVEAATSSEVKNDLSGGNSQRLERLEALVGRRQRCLLPLVDIVAAASDSLDELYQRVHEAIVKLPEYSSVSLSQLLVRELRSDFLPGRCHWASFHSCGDSDSDASTLKKKVVVAQDMNSFLKDIGIGGKSHVQKKEDTNNGIHTDKTRINSNVQTLRRACLVGDRSVAIELLQPLSGTKPPLGAFRIWVHLLMNPGCQEGLSEMHPEWPPLQGIVSGGAKPTLGHLKRAICAAISSELQRQQQQQQRPELEQQLQQLSTAPMDSIALYRFNPQTVQWTQLLPPANGKISENITQNPFSVKEGDQFCAHISTSINKVIIGAQMPIKVARTEDLDLRFLREEEKQQKEDKKRAKKVLFLDIPDSTSNTTNNAPRRKETLLMIGRGGESSDDDEDDTSGGGGADAGKRKF